MAAPVILVEAQPRRAADGVAQTVRLAGMGGARPYHYGGEHWRAGLAGLPTFICSLDFVGDELGTGGVPQAAELEWAPARAVDLAEIANHVWADAPISVRIGPEGSLPAVRLAGKVMSGLVDAGHLKLALTDPAVDLKKPLLTERYGGTGGLDGPAEWEGTIKRRLWGRLWNVAGAPIDPPNNIYAFADPGRPLQEIYTLRDKGATAAAITFLDWQGTAAATLAALQAAVAPSGGGVVCPSIACAKWWTQPAGDLCADIKGEIGAGYVETTAEIALRLVEARAGPAFAAGPLAAAVAARPAPVGWLADSDTATVAEMLDQLLGNSSLLWLLDATGQIVLREWAWSAPAAAVRSHEVRRTKSFRPLATRKIGYRHNETKMARGDIAAIVFADGLSYLDGTPVQDLQPAQPGATLGAPSGTPVGGIAAEDVSATIKAGGGVANAQVSTGAVIAEAISSGDTMTLASPISGNGLWRTAISYNLTVPVLDPPVDWAIVAILTASQGFPSGDKAWNARLMADGVRIAGAGGEKSEDSLAMSGRAIWGSGSHTMVFEWKGDSGANLAEANLVILWLKR